MLLFAWYLLAYINIIHKWAFALWCVLSGITGERRIYTQVYWRRTKWPPVSHVAAWYNCTSRHFLAGIRRLVDEPIFEDQECKKANVPGRVSVNRDNAGLLSFMYPEHLLITCPLHSHVTYVAHLVHGSLSQLHHEQPGTSLDTKPFNK